MTKNIKHLTILILLCLAASACALPQVGIPVTGGLPRALPTDPQAQTSTSLVSTVSALQTAVAAASATAAAPSSTLAPTALPSSTPQPVDTAQPSTPQPAPSATALPTATAPLATAGASPTTTLTVPCNKADFVADVTVPDYTHFDFGNSFTKTWRLRNSGGCVWTTDYAIVFDKGYAMGNTFKVNLSAPVLPQHTVDVSVSFTAPNTSGIYQGYWLLQDVDGKRFGIGADASGDFWVKIGVGDLNTQTPVASGSCSLISMSPGLNATYSPNNELDMRWTVTNTSGSTWSRGQVDYIYISGTKMYTKNPTYDLSTDVPSGNSVDIIVDSKAPSSPGYYSTTWAIVQGSTRLCYLSNTIYVK